MPTTIYNSSLITTRNRDKVIAQQIKQANNSGNPIIIPQAGYGSYLLGEVDNGNINYFRKTNGCTDVNLSCNCTGYTTTSIMYTITYDGNTNTSGTAPVDGSSPYISGSSVTVLGSGSLAKTSYGFSVWNTAPDGSGISYSPTNTFIITSDITLYAQWVIAYTVTYNGNTNTSGTAPVDGSSPYISGSSVTVLGGFSIAKFGYIFIGWNTAADGSGTSYSPSNSFIITSNTTLYAQWLLLPTYTVTYNGNTNTAGTAPVDVLSPHPTGSNVIVLGPGSLVKTGFFFNIWNTAADGSGTSYSPTNTFIISSNTTLYAQWI